MNKKIKVLLILLGGLIYTFGIMTYVDSGYNQFLEQTLIEEQGQTALDFDALIESGAISTEQLAKGIVAELVDEKGNIILDNLGISSETQFQHGSIDYNIDQSTTSLIAVPVIGSQMNFTLNRKARVLFIAQIVAYISFNDDVSKENPDAFAYFINFYIDGEEKWQAYMQAANFDEYGPRGDRPQTGEIHKIVKLNEGDHTLELKHKIDNQAGKGWLAHYVISYIVLGN